MVNSIDKLPEGWILTTLGEIGEWSSGGTPLRKNSQYFGGQIPWIKIGDLSDGLITDIDENITEEGLDNSSAKLFPSGSLVVGMYGGIGKLGILTKPSATNQACGVLLAEGITTKLIPYIFYYLLSSRDQLISLGYGGAQTNISQTTLKNYPCPLPPLNEQYRITEKLDQLMIHQQKAKEALEKIPPLIEKFKQLVLESAFRGDLTADWRAENPDVESAQELLKQIETLSNIPDTWRWVTVEKLGNTSEQTVLTGPFGSNLSKTDFRETGIPVITIGCLQERGLDLDKAMYISKEKAQELDKYRLQTGDFLFSRMASVGRVALIEDKLNDSIFNYHLMRLRLSQKYIEAKYFLYYVRGAKAVENYLKEVNHGATRDGINTTQLTQMPVALPPLDEQKIIVQIIDTYWVKINNIEDIVQNAFEKLELSTQLILSKALRGELVPQNPNDEPASLLLERIRQEKEKLNLERQQQRKAKMTTKTLKKKKTRRQLTEVLAESQENCLSPEQLFEEAGFNQETVEPFYQELSYAIESEQIEEIRPNNTKIYLTLK